MNRRRDIRAFNKRVRAIGLDMFAHAEAARPRRWQTAWWTEQLTRALDHKERLRGRAFQFVDCLPALKTDCDIRRHLAEYFDPSEVRLPRIVHAAVAPGIGQAFRERIIGAAARSGATHMAGRFITGYDIPSVIKTLEQLRRDHMAFTLDVLGESTTSFVRADAYASAYHTLINHLTPIASTWSERRIIDRD